jgi:RNA polymerase sigma factor (sigma-70 family)
LEIDRWNRSITEGVNKKRAIFSGAASTTLRILTCAAMKKNRLFDEIFDAHEDADLVPPAHVPTTDELIVSWHEQHAAAIYRYLVYRYGRTAAEHAGEIVNDAFLRLYQAMESGETIENPRAWALTVARRLMLDRIRRGGPEETRRRAFARLIVDPVPTPYDALCERQKRAAFQRAWQMLSALERHCMRLRASGWTPAEIGQFHGLDRRRIGEIIARALRQLEKSW